MSSRFSCLSFPPRTQTHTHIHTHTHTHKPYLSPSVPVDELTAIQVRRGGHAVGEHPAALGAAAGCHLPQIRACNIAIRLMSCFSSPPFGLSLVSLPRVPSLARHQDDPTGQRQAGFIAEDTADLFPLEVHRDEQGRPDSIVYEQFIPYLVESIKTLHAHAKQMRAEIDELRACGCSSSAEA